MFRSIRRVFQPPEPRLAPKDRREARQRKPGKHIREIEDSYLTALEVTEAITTGGMADTDPAVTVSEGDESVASVADSLLTKMPSQEEEPVADISQILAEPVEAEGTPAGEEKDGSTPPVDSADKQAGNSEKNDSDDFMSDIFQEEDEEQGGIVGSLISSLPDIGVQELYKDAEEVKVLMHEWRQSQK